MKNKKILFTLQAILGIILLVVGRFLLTSDEIKMLSGLCIGFGAAMMALGIGSLVRFLIISATEDEQFIKMKNIEVKDERNTRIREKAGHMTAKVMNYVLIVFILVLGFMGVDKFIIIMAAGLIVIEFILVVIFSNYFAKRM